MAVLNNRDQIVSRKPKTITVSLPDREDTITVRRWSAMDWERSKANGADDNNLGLQLAMVLCDENGKRLFDPDDPEDRRACAESFGLDESEAILTAAGKLIVSKEDIKKNSSETPSSDSVST